jgi:signal transduction histidine kinase/CheY-like chemotaxis protein
MKFIKKVSIKSKIIGLMFIITIIIILIGFTFVIINNIKTIRRNVLNNTIMSTKLIAEYCFGPLTFDDKKSAREILAKLETLPSVLDAAIYDEFNSYFVSYNKSGDSLQSPDFTMGAYNKFEGAYLYTCEPIIYNDIKEGTVYIRSSTKGIESEIRSLYLTMFILLMGLMALAFFFANWLQKFISYPILELAKAMEKVSSEKNYSIRIQNITNDEIGILYEGFNTMLEQISNWEKERDKANDSLKKAKDKAEESDKLKSAFLANMSHEIRTPMNAIVGFADLLSEPDLTFIRRIEFIKHINNSSNALLALINDIIDISKIEASQLGIVKRECKINKILEELYISFREIKASQYNENIELRFSSLPYEVVTLTDAIRIRQILWNLIGNALKFTEMGYVEFGCSLNQQQMLQFFVKDTGIGLSEDQIPIIFDRFRKATYANNSKLYRGAGLGLAISKSLVHLLGGEIWVTSVVDKGSIFYFTIPYQPVESNLNTSETMNKAVRKDYDWQNKVILIAEDEETNYRYLEEVLRKTKVKIIWAKDGKNAVELAKMNDNINLVLMDIKMPVMNGYDATKQIKLMYQQLPVISQTAYAMAGESEKSLEAGCDDYIAKPINGQRLLAMINKYL